MKSFHAFALVVQILGLAVGISLRAPVLIAWSAAFLALEAWYLTRP